MKNLFDFLRTALPLITIGLLLAICFAKGARKQKKEKHSDDYGTEGMCIGMCLGTAIGTAFENNTGIGICLGVVLGLAVGSCIKKENCGEKND